MNAQHRHGATQLAWDSAGVRLVAPMSELQVRVFNWRGTVRWRMLPPLNGARVAPLMKTTCTKTLTATFNPHLLMGVGVGSWCLLPSRSTLSVSVGYIVPYVARLIVCWGLFEDAFNSRGYITSDFRIVNWKLRVRKWSWPNVMSCSTFCLQEMRKAAINRSQSSRWWRRGLKPKPIENEQANKWNATFGSGINVWILNAEMSTDKRLYIMGYGTPYRVLW
jgi:hypothetical protein